jgi:hypothetical protein
MGALADLGAQALRDDVRLAGRKAARCYLLRQDPNRHGFEQRRWRMILSDEAKRAASDYVNGLNQGQTVALYLRLSGLPVKLRSTNGAFNASGVIAGVYGKKTWIYTATHNLRVHAARDEAVDDLMKTSFKNNVRVWPSTFWNAKWDKRFLGRTKEASIKTIEHDASAADSETGNDVCKLTIEDGNFAKNVREMLKDCAILEKDFRTALPVLGAGQLSKLLRNTGDMYGYTLVQVGFGKISKAALAQVGDLQFRVATVQHNARIDTDDGYTNVVLLNASDTASTWEGDSGGPLFAVSSVASRLYLVGVNLGSNFYADRTVDDANAPVTNNAVTHIPG